jgi:hypothetical protein
MIWKIRKKSKLKCERRWKIQRKVKLNSEKIGEMGGGGVGDGGGGGGGGGGDGGGGGKLVRNVIIEINNVIMKIKWRGKGQITSERASL